MKYDGGFSSSAATVIDRLRAAMAMLVAVMLVVVVSSCSTDDESQFDYLRLQIAGQPTLTISKKGVWVRGVIVFFHGPDEDEFTMASSATYREMTAALVGAGFAVVSSKAGGNDFDNPQVVDMYRQVGLMALQNFHIGNLFFLSQSYGIIPALKLLASDYAHLRGLAAIRPLTNGDPVPRADPPSDGAKPAPAQALAGKYIRIYLNQSDAQPTANGHSSDIAEKLGTLANVSVVPCSDDPTGSSCLQGHDIAKWFTSLDGSG